MKIGNRKQAKNITRVTGDNPLTDPKIITQMLLDHIKKGSDYTFCNQIPIGAGSEIVKFKTLKKLSKIKSALWVNKRIFSCLINLGKPKDAIKMYETLCTSARSI